MGYSAEISRDNPTCFLFVLDQSGSMDERMHIGPSKAQFLADIVNKTIYTLTLACTKADGIRNFFDIGVIGYGGGGVKSGLGDDLSGSIFRSISSVANSPLRIEVRNKIESDGAGGVFERRVSFPVWFDSVSSGGTPMVAALTRAVEALVIWCDGRPYSYPPTILHITDGASTDGDPEQVASALRQISTSDGPCLLFNANVSTLAGNAVTFPDHESELPDSYARLLFRMSSLLPQRLARLATDKGYSVTDNARGFMFNADPKGLVDFFDIGTRPRLSADR
jgi:hypothetical protein